MKAPTWSERAGVLVESEDWVLELCFVDRLLTPEPACVHRGVTRTALTV